MCSASKRSQSPGLFFNHLPEPHPNSALRSPKPSKKTKKPLKNKHCKCLANQLHERNVNDTAQVAVAELFSPPRLTEQARCHGASGLAFDIKQGCDLGDRGTQEEVDHLLQEARPYLLTASPPVHSFWWLGPPKRVLQESFGKSPTAEREPLSNPLLCTADPAPAS